MWCKLCEYGSKVAVIKKCPMCGSELITSRMPYSEQVRKDSEANKKRKKGERDERAWQEH